MGRSYDLSHIDSILDSYEIAAGSAYLTESDW